ncbi:MarR family transcriptional regulator [Thalassoglobus sp. JC818]|uniref:MarR family winged helix-turn-helix transcriptional regulator n=1 Tax=Thalassoglobus sp. JC818 TaxID=3232136 RepID=UPI0034575C7C
MSLRAAYLSMHRQADRVLQPFGLTANQYVVLSVLDDEDGITQQLLVDRVNSDPNTIRPILVALEKKRFIRRKPHPTDRRARSVHITPTGRKAFAKMRNESEEFRTQLIGELPPQDVRSLINLLNQVTLNMQPGAQRVTTDSE